MNLYNSIKTTGTLLGGSLALAGLLAATPVWAASSGAPGDGSYSLSDLVNTGSEVLAGQHDWNYGFDVINGTAPVGDGYSYVGNGALPGSWLANSATSQWLTPTTQAGQAYDAGGTGSYRWTLSFDLGTLNPADLQITGRFLADSQASIWLNGVPLPGVVAASTVNWTDFAVNSGFVAGTNTFTFELSNLAAAGGLPAGLRVEFLDVTASPVPEPASGLLMLGGMGLLGYLAARRRKA